MKVLIADAFAERGRQALGDSGIEVVYDPSLKDSELLRVARSERPDVLVVRSTLVSRELLRASSLGLVVRAGSGYNTIDVEAASASETYVANCPGTNAIAVAELAFGLILALDRRIPANVADLRKGLWNKGTYSKARGLYGRTLGLIGLGAVGQAMVPRARAFGMEGFARILFQVHPLDSYPLDLAIHLDLQRTFDGQRQVELGNLVALHQVRVRIVLAVKLGVFGDLAIKGQPGDDGELHRLAVNYRQRSGQTQTHRANVTIDWRTLVAGGTGAEHFAPGLQLHVDF